MLLTVSDFLCWKSINDSKKEICMGARKDINVGTLIARERNAKGWKQEELAERIGVSTSLVGRLETDDVPLTLGKAKLIAKALGIDEEAIVTKAFMEKITGSRRRQLRKILNEYDGYPKVLKLIQAMQACPNCCHFNTEVESLPSVDAEKLLISALDSLEIGLYIRDITGKVVYTNEALNRMILVIGSTSIL